MITPEYFTTGENDLELIRDLWVQLNNHHLQRARYFSQHYERMRFEDRKEYFLGIARTGRLYIDLARDRTSGRFVGYCVSSISAEKNGEIESIFVEDQYRSAGVGSALMKRVLTRMDNAGVARKRVSVADGNETAGSFYRKFGFYPRMAILEQKNEFS